MAAEYIGVRHVPEQSGAVLDTSTGLRDWFDSYGDAIRIAAARNAGSRCIDGEFFAIRPLSGGFGSADLPAKINKL